MGTIKHDDDGEDEYGKAITEEWTKSNKIEMLQCENIHEMRTLLAELRQIDGLCDNDHTT